jgi:hypothetical protein
MAGLPNTGLLEARKIAIYRRHQRSIGLRPKSGERIMTGFLFLKSGLVGHKNGSRRGVSNDGIDVKLLSLLSARYV